MGRTRGDPLARDPGGCQDRPVLHGLLRRQYWHTRRLLSARRVRDAYLGYATQQFRRLAHGTTGRRAEKHARHLVRPLEQGEGLHRTGRLAIRPEDPERVREAGVRIAAAPGLAEALLAAAAARFDEPGVLPAEPDEAAVEVWLLRVRDHHYDLRDPREEHAGHAAASARA